MSLTPGLASAVDLFHKLQRDVGRLDEEVTSDSFFNLVITGYSLIVWVRNDQTIPPGARTDAVIDGLRNQPWLKVCGDLANASKHFKLHHRQPVVTDATLDTGCGDIEVEIENRFKWTAREVSVGVLQVWKTFFEHHGVWI
jgi:hypothetical protein